MPLPSSFIIRAKDQQGNPVVMSVSPDSVTNFRELGTSGANGRTTTARTAPKWRVWPQFVWWVQNEKLSSNLVGLDVYNTSNQDIGQIKDLAVALRAAHALISCQSAAFLALARIYVAMTRRNIQSLVQQLDQKWHATTSATSDQLKSAPEFSVHGSLERE